MIIIIIIYNYYAKYNDRQMLIRKKEIIEDEPGNNRREMKNLTKIKKRNIVIVERRKCTKLRENGINVWIKRRDKELKNTGKAKESDKE